MKDTGILLDGDRLPAILGYSQTTIRSHSPSAIELPVPFEKQAEKCHE